MHHKPLTCKKLFHHSLVSPNDPNEAGRCLVKLTVVRPVKDVSNKDCSRWHACFLYDCGAVFTPCFQWVSVNSELEVFQKIRLNFLSKIASLT